jgi:hypothetical protein
VIVVDGASPCPSPEPPVSGRGAAGELGCGWVGQKIRSRSQSQSQGQGQAMVLDLDFGNGRR